MDINNINVYVHFTHKAISINNEVFFLDNVLIDLIKDSLPTNILSSQVTDIIWTTNISKQTYFILKDGSNFLFENSKENFEIWLQPYVTLWQNEKTRLEQEEQQIQEEWNKFENQQTQALLKLNQYFDTASENAYLVSSLGITVDANRIAKDNIQGLIEEIGEGTVQFCDWNNQFHELTKDQLEILKSEINQNGQYLYLQKWDYREAIENASNIEKLNQIVNSIVFKFKNFSEETLGLAKVGI